MTQSLDRLNLLALCTIEGASWHVIAREAHFLAKEELFATPVLGPLIRSVNAIPIRRGALRG